ncbi:glycoside hydrolase family 78 protein [Sclerotinia borealis F-4128]|uniref:Glycoside hydrolase family 78 protein n=1 Tax=Sclerotinia borealis (strain F-4128) TaxID=1432307 RepID=W9CHK5_SCLBF|nr:glycoside hydrolase family 78 protein [Sclerotinia borealis F-4128]
MICSSLSINLLGLFVVSTTAVPYEEYILTPNSRTLIPASVYNVNGSVTNPEALAASGCSGSASFGSSSAVTYDFEKNIAGIVSFNVGSVDRDVDQFVGISFTESSLWINENGCDATADAGIDEALWFPVTSGGYYRAETQHQRGGFRYLNVYHNTSGSVEVSNLTIQYTALPHKAENELRSYTGYFHSNDDQVNRVWYAGAYTNDMCTIDPTAGNSLVYLGVINSNSTVTEPVAWWNNYTIANGTSVLTDGAKRDRLVWPGDIAISGPSVFVSTNDMITIKNSLDSLLVLQNASGALPYAGVPFSTVVKVWSFTYHLHSLIDIHDYYLFTGDLGYLQEHWGQFKLGMNFSLGFIDESRMAYVPVGNPDWLRVGMGGHNIEANSILYYTLNLGTKLSKVLNDSVSTLLWPDYAAGIKSAANSNLWDFATNLYRDNDSLPLTTLHPQDGNAWAIFSGLVDSPSRALLVSDSLAARWNQYGAPAPEGGSNVVSPFVSSFEIQAHYLAGRADRAVRMIKFMWGDFMLDDPRMTNSTFIEGYSTDGSLHYAPYANDPRVSHAHGWSTGPTSALTFHGAGLKVTSGAGKTWSVAPNLGGLTDVEAGFETPLGNYAVEVMGMLGRLSSIVITTPVDTTGSISVPYTNQTAVMTLQSKDGKAVTTTHQIKAQNATSERYTIEDVAGGNWTVKLIY